MDALWSMGLVQTYFAHSDYLGIYHELHTTYLSTDTINQIEPRTHHCVKFFVGRVGYTPLGPLCNNILAIIAQSNAAMPAYLVL